jgi:hypothetical protein
MNENTETLTVHPKGDGVEIIVQHDQSGSAYGIDLSKSAYEQLRLHFVSGSFSADKIKEAYTDGFSDSRYDFDTENYR